MQINDFKNSCSPFLIPFGFIFAAFFSSNSLLVCFTETTGAIIVITKSN